VPPEVGIVVPDVGSSAVVTVTGWLGSLRLAMMEITVSLRADVDTRERGFLHVMQRIADRQAATLLEDLAGVDDVMI
jgi:hypothetical protein